MNTVYDRIRAIYLKGGKSFMIGREDMAQLLSDAEDMKFHAVGLPGKPMKDACDKIADLIEQERYEDARTAIAGTRLIFGETPRLASLTAEIDMIEFLSRPKSKKDKKNKKVDK